MPLNNIYQSKKPPDTSNSLNQWNLNNSGKWKDGTLKYITNEKTKKQPHKPFENAKPNFPYFYTN